VTTPSAGWTDELARARLHFVTGKGGTGKTTLAAAIAVAGYAAPASPIRLAMAAPTTPAWLC
jgi:predicted ATPase